MNTKEGYLSLDQLKQLALDDEIQTVIVAFTDLYGRLLGKRLDIDYFLNNAVEDGVKACDYLFTVDMEMEVIPGYEFANWEKGYGDVKLIPDLTTLRHASWLNKTALVLADVVDEEDKAIAISPRMLLLTQVQRLNDLGFSANVASELEYHLYKTSYEDAAAQGYNQLNPMGWYIEDYHILQGTRAEVFNAEARHHLKKSGISVENTKGEWGHGQNELNIVYDEVMNMADNHIIFKQCLKEIADQIGLSVTFMAKPTTKGAGSSCHIHLSLWREGRNAFCGDEVVAGLNCSKIFQHFLAGWIEHLPELAVFYAPTVNSYKRYQNASWAPTGLAWSYDNRTAGFRIVDKDSDKLRIECRMPGADCNPYLAYAAVIASGIDGIVRKLTLPEPYIGDAYQHHNGQRVPATLDEAILLFKNSEFVQNVFGREVQEHYCHFFEVEQNTFTKAVTDWERRRYFERI